MDRGFRHRMTGTVASALAWTTFCTIAIGGIADVPIKLHSGSADPASEGWGSLVFLPSSPFGTPVTGPVINDAGSGFDAWKIDTMDRSGTGANASMFGVYEYFWSAAERNRLTHSPRHFMVRLRILEDSLAGAGAGGFDFAVANFISFNGREYRPLAGITSTGDFQLALHEIGTIATVPGGTSYHFLELRDLDRDNLFDVYLNGSLVHSGYAGSVVPLTNSRIVFGDGDGSSGKNANVNYSLVQLNVPEPACLGLMGIMLLPWLSRRRQT